jgi:hypothetical protein
MDLSRGLGDVYKRQEFQLKISNQLLFHKKFTLFFFSLLFSGVSVLKISHKLFIN